MKKELSIDAALVVGNSGEYTVWVDDTKVSEKRGGKFPDPKEVVAAVRATQT